MAGIRIKNVTKAYHKQDSVIKNCNLEIKDREFVVLVGPSGSGKSTLLRMIAGLEDITEGDIYIGNTRVNRLSPGERNTAMVFQNYALFPHMTVYDNIAFGLETRKYKQIVIADRVRKTAGILGIYDLLERKPDTLSGGQQQRVALGRAMVMEPAVFLMDEPLSNLDAGLRETMRLELIRLHKEINKTFIYVTHDQREALTMGQRVVVLNEGRIQQVDSPERIYTFPENTFVGGFIGRPAMNFFNGNVGKNDDGINVVLKDGQVLKIPRYRGDVLNQSGYVNQDVVVGIRPEHMHFDTNPGKKCSDLKITVVNNEIVGPRSNLYFMMDKEIKTVETQQYCDYTPGTDVTLKVEEQRIRVFDRQSGSRII